MNCLNRFQYWEEIQRLLIVDYKLDKDAALAAIKTYLTVLINAGVGDMIYHAPVDETAKGIVEGGYVSHKVPKLGDGVEFKLGMPIVCESGREILTSEELHAIDSFEFDGKMKHCIVRKGEQVGIDLTTLYSSQKSRIAFKIAALTFAKMDIDKKITELKIQLEEED